MRLDPVYKVFNPYRLGHMEVLGLPAVRPDSRKFNRCEITPSMYRRS